MTRLGKHFIILFVSGWLVLVGDLPTITASPSDSAPSSKQNLVAQGPKKKKKGGKKGKKSGGMGAKQGGGKLPRGFVPRKFANTTWGWNNGIVP
jgi:hypothetical protein